MNQVSPDFLTAAQDYVPMLRQGIAAAIDSDDPAEILIEARAAVIQLEQIEKLLRVGYWRPPMGERPPRLKLRHVMPMMATAWFLQLAAAVTPRHPKFQRAMSMLAAVGDEIAWQINHDHDGGSHG